MALITFLSDFGDSDHYVPAIKAKIYSLFPEQKIIDISHRVAKFDIAHGAFVLKAVYESFPKGSVHLTAIKSSTELKNRFIALESDGHYFIGADNGLLSLVYNHQPGVVVGLNDETPEQTSFPEKDVLAPNAALLANGKALKELGQPIEDMVRLLNKEPRATRQKISGSVIHVDHYGNLITNIKYDDYAILSKGKKYKIIFGRNQVNQVHQSISSVVDGESFIVFNSLGLLEIGINMGNGSELLGLHYDSPVQIIFEE